MIRIYAKFEDVGTEYYTFVPVEISIEPFEDECYYLDLEKGKTYHSIGNDKEWKTYNGTKRLGQFLYNPKTKEYIDSKIMDVYYESDDSYVELEDGREISLVDNDFESGWFRYQDYKDGKPIGEPYFEN